MHDVIALAFVADVTFIGSDISCPIYDDTCLAQSSFDAILRIVDRSTSVSIRNVIANGRTRPVTVQPLFLEKSNWLIIDP